MFTFCLFQDYPIMMKLLCCKIEMRSLFPVNVLVKG